MTALLGRTGALTAAFVLLACGCAHVGPKTVPLDRSDYGSSIAESWKEQTLLNIVKLRYLDLPVFMDVSSVVAGYSLQTGIKAEGVLSSEAAVQGNYGSVGGQAVYTDRPTVTYVPLTGEKFLRQLITPIDPKNIFFLIQSGYSAEFILRLTVDSLNGVRNQSLVGGRFTGGDPAFHRAVELIREVQSAGAVGMKVEEGKDRKSAAVIFFRREGLTGDVAAKAEEVRRLLGLPEEGQHFTLVYSPVRGKADELTVMSRSMLQILTSMAAFVDVPEEHLRAGVTASTLENVSAESYEGPVRIRSGREKPPEAFAAVRYRGSWFWIDDSDLVSKRALLAVVFFFTLAESGEKEKLPQITIPAQ